MGKRNRNCKVLLGRIEIFDKLDKLIDFADFYIIRCNMDISAAETAFKVIFDI